MYLPIPYHKASLTVFVLEYGAEECPAFQVTPPPYLNNFHSWPRLRNYFNSENFPIYGILENCTSLLPSVLLRVCNNSNNVNSNKESSIAWCYSDDDFIIRTLPDTNFFVICSTDTGSCKTCSKKDGFYKNCMQLQGFPIDSHTFT